MTYWLMKSEPSEYSIEDLKKDKTTPWDGVRNYQARNFMRDQMKLNDKVLFYHSNASPPGIAGIGYVSKLAYPDFTAWDPKNKHFDPKSSPEKPIWMMVDVAFDKKFSRVIGLPELREKEALLSMLVLKKGMRLSIQPVEQAHFELIDAWGSAL